MPMAFRATPNRLEKGYTHISPARLFFYGISFPHT
jgi:hypothetical protein